MSGPREMPRVTDKLRAGIDEYKCEWVIFPDQRQYLLPILSKTDKITPTFTETGVAFELKAQDKDAAMLVEKFLALAATEENGEIRISTEETLNDFFLFIRKLLQTNYEISDAEVAAILTVTSAQMSQLFGTILTDVVMRR